MRGGPEGLSRHPPPPLPPGPTPSTCPAEGLSRRARRRAHLLSRLPCTSPRVPAFNSVFGSRASSLPSAGVPSFSPLPAAWALTPALLSCPSPAGLLSPSLRRGPLFLLLLGRHLKASSPVAGGSPLPVAQGPVVPSCGVPGLLRDRPWGQKGLPLRRPPPQPLG